MVEIATLKAKNATKNKRTIAAKEKLLRAVEELHEFNRCSGTVAAGSASPIPRSRACRHGPSSRRRCRSRRRASRQARGDDPARGTCRGAEAAEGDRAPGGGEDVLGKDGSGVDYLIGTMIEVPRGAVTADEIAKEAQFFSFGTNDLTQMGFGLSRDDAGKFLLYYQEHGLLEKDPFQTLDAAGSGCSSGWASRRPRRQAEAQDRSLRRARWRPRSIRFFHEVGLDYVSCSPYRVPIARLGGAGSARGLRLGLTRRHPRADAGRRVDDPLGRPGDGLTALREQRNGPFMRRAGRPHEWSGARMLSYFRYVNGRIESHAEFRRAADGTPTRSTDRPRGPDGQRIHRPRGSLPLPPAAIEDCLSEVHHPKADDYGTTLFHHRSRVSATTPTTPSRPVSWISSSASNYLITHHKGPMRSISSAREQCGKNIQAAMPRGLEFPAAPGPRPVVRALLSRAST